MAAAGRYHVSSVACLPFRLAPLFDKGDGEESGTNDVGRLGDVVRYGGGWAARAVCLVSSRAGHSDEVMRNDGTEDVSCFRYPMIAVSFISYSFLFFIALPISLALLVRAACLPVPCRGRDELCGLCVALCSRLIASVSSGILFLVPCDGFLSAFLCLALLLYERLYFRRSLALAPPRLPFFGDIGTRAIFYRFTCLLTIHLSRSSRVLPICELLRAVRLS